jgi:hypothetical protein
MEGVVEGTKSATDNDESADVEVVHVLPELSSKDKLEIEEIYVI